MSEQVRRATDITEFPGVLPIDHLGTNHADALDTDPYGRLDQPRDRVRIQRGVIVQQQHEIGLGSDGQLQRRAYGTRQALRFRKEDHTSIAEGITQQLDRPIG